MEKGLFNICLLWLLCACGNHSQYYTAEDFAGLPKTDAHVHIYTADTAFIHQARQDNFRLLTIAVEEPPGMALQERLGIAHHRRFPQQVAFAATLSIAGWDHPNWPQKTIAHLDSMISAGAMAIKFYKTIGMELQDEAGNFVMIDHPRFDTVLSFLTSKGIPVIGHFGEPKDCWLPLEKMQMNSNRKYYSRHPEFHMYAHPSYPSYHEQIAARNRMLQKHPQLRFIGAHLGSLEWNTDTLAACLDKFPNMAVDMAARIGDLQFQAMKDRQKVRDFFIRYQDRLIYGTDRTAEDDGPAPQFIHEAWLRDWAFFTGRDTLRSPSFEGVFTGLQLPKTVVDKIYRDNAEQWCRGLR
ncbi:amidohydrolase family protein [Chitinophaga sp.]|uniref:amidohydrolase family protein n=1 Tax=Chitinophaga sp. TaxID=1869181 RepID=UPI0031D69BF3